MSSRLALAGLALASALVGGAASSYVAVAFAQQAPAVAPVAVPAKPTRFEHWCQQLDHKALRVAGERGWELVAAYNDLSETKIVVKNDSGLSGTTLRTTLPAMPTTYCFKRPAR